MCIDCIKCRYLKVYVGIFKYFECTNLNDNIVRGLYDL